MTERVITNPMLAAFERELLGDEKSKLTVEKYLRDVRHFMRFSLEKQVEKAVVLAYKAQLEKAYAVVSANSMLASLCAFFRFAGWNDLCVKQFKVQRKTFLQRRKGTDQGGIYAACEYR